MTGSKIFGNTAGGHTGGISNSASAFLSITSSEIYGDIANFNEGGIHNSRTLYIADSKIYENLASGHGEGICNWGGLA